MSKKRKFDYFDAFEKQAKLAVCEADLLIELIENFTGPENLKDMMERAHKIEHEGDEVSHSIFDTVTTDFITPIEREDILNMAQFLDSIIDYVEDIVQRFYMYNVHSVHHDAIDFAHLIKKSCEAIDAATEDFRNFKKSKKVKQLIVDINTYEEEADQLYIRILRELHTNNCKDPMHVIVWSHIFDRMEYCCDACEHVADVMNTVLLKNV